MLISSRTFARVVRSTALLLSVLGAAGIAACSDNPTTPSMSIPPSTNGTESIAVGGGILTVSPRTLTFGTQDIGSRSAWQPVTISNTGTGPMTISYFALGAGDATEFIIDGVTTIMPNSGACTYGLTIASGSSCIFQVGFVPTATGPHTATIDVQTDVGGDAVGVTGTGVLPSADLSVSASATPSPAAVGKPLTYTMTVRNAGPSAAARTQLAATVPSGTTFTSISATPDVVCATPAIGGTGPVDCTINASLEAGSARTITLVVKPLSGGKNAVSNTISVGSDASDPNVPNNITTVVTTVRGRK